MSTAVAAPPVNSYDKVPYPSHPFMQTHPDHLATIATMFGLKPVSARHCRVLELGCASGGNLIPMALSFPESEFVGVDLSARQVADGHKLIELLGIKNIQLKAMSITDVDESFGKFDYILCHGVYSWVPDFVRDKILQINHDNLSENGVGYISYNTFPGWHMRGMIRDMMCYHISRFTEKDPQTQVAQARTLLDFLAKSVRQNDKNPYGLLLKQELELLQRQPDSYLYHEHLEENNEPLYFYEFYQAAVAKGLRYLGEADFSVMLPSHFPAEVQKVLHVIAPNQIQMEQYLDFLRNRTFRQTLLCHEHQKPNYNIKPDVVTKFHVASPVKPKTTPVDIASAQPVEFKAPNEMTVNTPDPIVKSALMCLSEAWPRAIPFEELRKMARARVNSVPPDSPEVVQKDTEALCRAFLTAFAGASNSLIELWQNPPAFAVSVSDKPMASPLARLQAQSSTQVTNLRHQPVNITEFDRQLLPLLDGTHDRASLIYHIMKKFKKGDLTVAQNNVRITDEVRAQEILGQTLDNQLPKIAQAALLQG